MTRLRVLLTLVVVLGSPQGYEVYALCMSQAVESDFMFSGCFPRTSFRNDIALIPSHRLAGLGRHHKASKNVCRK